jgi:hypothetical protein
VHENQTSALTLLEEATTGNFKFGVITRVLIVATKPRAMGFGACESGKLFSLTTEALRREAERSDCLRSFVPIYSLGYHPSSL